MYEAMEARGVDLSVAGRFGEMLREQGFVNVVEQRQSWPVGPWIEEPRLKQGGEWLLEDVLSGMEAASYGIVMKWSGETKEVIEREVEAVREDIGNPEKRYYVTM